jgi:hypothetical protein
MLKKILIGLGVLSNLATLLGLWIAYISAPTPVQSKIGHVLLIAGGCASAALYLVLAWAILRQPAEKTTPGPTNPVRIFISSPGISFRLMQDRSKAALDLVFTISAAIELTHIKVRASTKQQEICDFIDSAPAHLEAGQHERRVEAAITPQARSNLSLGAVINLTGIATVRMGAGLRHELINIVTVALVEDFTQSTRS